MKALQEEGVDTIFGFPGGAVIDIYDELVKTLAGGDESTLEGYPFKGEG